MQGVHFRAGVSRLAINRPRRWPSMIAILVAVLIAGCTASPAPATPDANHPEPEVAGARFASVQVRVIATGLVTPWELAFAPDGRLFVTERPGRIRLITDGRLLEEPVAVLPVRETAESGLLGLAIDPNFPGDPYLYVMYGAPMMIKFFALARRGHCASAIPTS